MSNKRENCDVITSFRGYCSYKPALSVNCTAPTIQSHRVLVRVNDLIYNNKVIKFRLTSYS